jgi:demethylmenaquinone methyltransferase/2-methoxy-6-polyprenyl-1,4-benzoquinol methylase
MMSKIQGPPGERAGNVRRLFGAIAPRYDLINDLQSFGLHRRWKRRLVREAQLREGETALDVGCGTGDIAFLLAQHSSKVVALDFSLPMLARAHARSAAALGVAARLDQDGVTPPLAPEPFDRGVHFLCGDALRLPLSDEVVDVVTVSYGLRNLADLDQGLGEMWRVTRPGGRILILDFGKPENSFWRACYFAYLKVFVPACGRIVAGNAAAYRYILDSLKDYPAQAGLPRRLEPAGWSEPRTINLLGGIMSLTKATKRP